MVAVVNGSGLGLFTSRSTTGSATTGQAGEQVFVNSTTGNLVIQDFDESLTATGLDIGLIRTYNSQGLVDGDNDDNWRIGVYRRVALTGTVNTAGSTVVKTFGDGAEVTYAYNTTLARYVSTEGDGAHDFLTFASSQWTWTDGSGRNTETYDSSGKIINAKDTDGNTVTYTYTGTLLTQVTDASGQTTFLDYTGNNLQRIRVVSSGLTQTLTNYTYDAQNRLSTVTVDLTPSNNSIADNNTYVTTYTYDGTSKRIASITQRAGGSANVNSSVSFTYVQQEGKYWLKTYTDGEGRVTTVNYGAPAVNNPVTVNANPTVLINTETTTTNYGINTGLLGTTDTQSVTNDYGLNTGLLSTTDSQTDNYNRNNGVLTTPASAWEGPSIRGTGLLSTVRFDGNGNGFAAWADGINVMVSQYSKASNTWSAATVMDGTAGGISELELAVDATGNAVLLWSRGATGYRARVFSGSSWGATLTVTASVGTAKSLSINNGVAALMYGSTRYSVVRYAAGAWTYIGDAHWVPPSGPVVGGASDSPSVSVDSTGGVRAVWQSGWAFNSTPLNYYVYSLYYTPGSGWGSVSTVAAGQTTQRATVRAVFNGTGNGFAVWTQSNRLWVSQFTRSTSTWSAAVARDTLATSIQSPRFVMDEAGNAVLAWAQQNGANYNAYALTYSAASSAWSTPIALQSTPSNIMGSVEAAISGGKAAVTWGQSNGSNRDLYAARFDSSWSTATLMESLGTDPSYFNAAVDSGGNVAIGWTQSDGSANRINTNRYNVVTDFTPYYQLSASPSWQEVANAVYGVNSAAAGAALSAAMPAVTLMPNGRLTGLPASLSVTITITVPPYYLVPSNGTGWQAVAAALYGIDSPEAAAALAAQMGGQSPTAGTHLTGLPSTISVTTSITITVPPYYQVPSNGTGWDAVTLALYGVNSSAASAALAAQMGGQLPTAGTRLTGLPTTLSVSTTISVTPYYLVPSNPAWPDITQAVYGTSDANAVAALQAALPGVTLSAGLKLQVPLTLTYTPVLVANQVNANVNPNALINTDTTTTNYNVNTGLLSTTDSQSVTNTYGVNAGLLSTTDFQTTNYNRNNGALTTPVSAWAGPSLMAAGLLTTVRFDGSGNGFAAWAQGTNVMVSQYTKSSNTWSTPTVMDGATGGLTAVDLAVDATGNAVLLWARTSGGYQARVYSGSSWGATLTVTSTLGTARSLSINNGVAALMYGSTRYSVVRYAGGAWTSIGDAHWVPPSGPVVGGDSDSPSVSVDSSGGVRAVWQSGWAFNSTPLSYYVYSLYYTPGTGWGSVTTVAAGQTTQRANVRAVFNGSGNGFATWTQSNRLWVSQFTRSTSTWSAAVARDSLATTILSTRIVIDEAGNAALALTQQNGANFNAYALTYSAASSAWSTQVALQSTTTNVVGIETAISGGKAAVTWTQSNGSTNDLYAARFDSSWSAASLLENGTTSPGGISAAVDSGGNVAVGWYQFDGATNQFYTNRYVAALEGVPYYQLSASPSWQEVANAVYGVNSAAAGAALSAAMPGVTLIPNGRLTGLPATLSVTVPVTVPQYYLVPPSGTGWQAVAAALYGINNPAAATALSAQMGAQSPTSGAHLTNLPATLTVTTTSTITVPAYYLVPANGTGWQAVAAALYGINSAAAAAALATQMGSQVPSAGAHLTGLPATLSVVSTIPVAPYYLVPPNPTWQGITQAVYGTADPNAVAALQAAMPGITPAEGQHLTMPVTISYVPSNDAPGSYYRQTDIVDPLGLVSSYRTDIQGRLVSAFTPAVGGSQIETRFTYDADGNVSSVATDPFGLNRLTTFQYDSNGNQTLSRDTAGNTVARTYNAANQLLTETQYTTPDPDGAGSAQPTGPLVSRFAYDGEQHLRFAISAEGRVTEYRYNAVGQKITALTYTGTLYTATPFAESDLTTWAAARDQTQLERSDYAYDFRGNVSSITSYVTTSAAGAGTGTPSITRFTYDQRGNLLNTTEARGEATTGDATDYVTSYTYDGLSRMLTKVEWLAAGATRTTSTVYDDASNRVAITFANGLVNTTFYDRRGIVTSVVNSNTASLALGTTTYAYDADGRLRMTTDPTGVRQYLLYDEASRKVADIDGEGRLTQYVYNRAGQLIKAIRYSSLLSSSALATLVNGSVPADVTVTSLVNSLVTVQGRDATKDQISRNVYDNAGRLVFEIDPIGAVTKYFYDGASRITDAVTYLNPVSIAGSVNEVLPSGVVVTTNTNDRRLRNFYDKEGNLLGTLDALGYLVEYIYDSAGHLQRQVAYANQTNSANWLTGTLATLRPAADTEIVTDYEQDIVSYFFYDGQGRKVGVLDGEGYLTETVYDVAGNVSQSIRYQRQATYSAGSTLATLRSAATGTNQTQSYQYDGAGRVTQQTNIEGRVTSFVYDAADNLISSTRALGTTEARTQQARYDELGRVKQELTAEGSAAIAAGTPVATAWAQYSVSHVYDLAGRRVSSTDQNANKSLYYYDVDGRARFAIRDLGNGTGEVIESRYDALGQLTDDYVYTGRISTASLAGGLVDSTITSRVSAIAGTSDARTTTSYKLNGQVATVGNAEGALISYTYNSFGEVTAKSEKINVTTNLDHTYSYDKRGLLLTTAWDPTGINQRATNTYDGFGRLNSVTDQYNNKTRTEYDRLGRVITTYSALNNKNTATYDAFSRVLTTIDALNNTTTYGYNDATRTATLTTQEGIVVTTVRNRHGQQLTVTDGAGTVTTYGYNVNGQVISISDSLGALETRSYDRAGRLLTSTDARNVVTLLGYDAANRVLTRTEDSGGLNLLTSYQFDGQGRVIKVTEPSGRVTDTTYYTDGRVKQISIDAAGLNLRTAYTYDLRGEALTVTEAFGSGNVTPRVTQYVYDKLGRRTEQYVDPAGLNLRTRYRYDRNGNLTRQIDARNNSTWYVYDADSRLRFTVDALGGVTESRYDADDQVVGTIRYATPVVTTGFGDVVTTVSVTTNALDRLSQTVYDRDGRAKYEIDALGGVAERSFDGAGRVTRTLLYANAVAGATYSSTAGVTSALNAAGNTAGTVGTNDRVQWTAYDARGRAGFAVDAAGAVTRNTYDAADNLVGSKAFNNLYTGSAKDFASLTTWANANANGADRADRYWYDALNRLRFHEDSLGFLTESRYDDAARTQIDKAYITNPGLGASVTTAQVASATTGLANALDRVTTSERDKAGRIIRVTDALGNYELYGYDDLGNKTSYRNRLGNAWTYRYDANGRLLEEISPVLSAVHKITGADTAVSLTLGTTANASIVTRMTYDALGNVVNRTEGILRAGTTDDTTASRLTTYGYDVLGRQITVTLPAVAAYNAAADSTTLAGTAVVRKETAAQALTSRVTYDTLGDAVVNQDIAGNYSYKVYDQLGRVKYEIDTESYVSQHDYDRFGNETGFTRYAGLYGGALSAAPVTLSNYVAPAADASKDRTITKAYDKLNQLTSVKMASLYWYSRDATGVPTSPETQYEYNAFGQVFRTRQLVTGGATPTWAVSYTYFDNQGQVKATVDPLGYVTTKAYDALGNVTRQIEYANPTTSWTATTYVTPGAATPTGTPNNVNGYDRDVGFGYDVLDRLTTETRYNVEYSTLSGQNVSRTSKNTTTTYQYDAVGNRLAVIDDAGSAVYTYYDVLGRTRAVADVSRDVGNGAVITPITEFLRNSTGDVVRQIQYANSGAGVTATGYTVTANANGYDQVTSLLLDKQGHVLRVEDAMGADMFMSYTARGDLAKQWQLVTTNDAGVRDALVTIHEYDKLGREIFTVQPQTLPNGTGDTTPVLVVRTKQKYNAFGEVTEKTVFDAATTAPTAQEFFDYDTSGRLWRTNSGDGVTKVFLHDLAGRQTAEIRARDTDLTTFATASAAATAGGQILRTETRYDLNGNAIEQRLPSFTVYPTSALATTVLLGAVYKSSNPLLGYVTNPGRNWSPLSTVAGGGGPITDSTADPSYRLTQGRYLYWSDPTNVVGESSQVFEYRVAGSGGAWTSLAIDYVLDGSANRYRGANLAGLANGNYEYRLSYFHSGDGSTPFAISTGTITGYTASAGTLTNTTSSNLGANFNVSPVTTQSNDRWGQALSVTDALGNTTNYRYNQSGALDEKKLPSVQIVSVSTAGVVSTTTGRPTQENHYDALGRLIATKDGNGNVTVSVLNRAGAVTQEVHADGGTKEFTYDTFGNKVAQVDERKLNGVGFRTVYAYDKNNRLTQTRQEITRNALSIGDNANIASNSYFVNEVGWRLTDTNAESLITRYWYDLRGNIKKSASPGRNVKTYAYDINGNQVRETDAIGGIKKWTYDYFGRALTHTELGSATADGAMHTYVRDRAGLTTSTTSNVGQNITYSYDAAGHLTGIAESGTPTGTLGAGLTGLNRQTTFSYDALGRHIREKTVVDGVIHQDGQIQYDAAGRLAVAYDLGMSVQFSYDAQSNRTRILGNANANNVYYYSSQLLPNGVTLVLSTVPTDWVTNNNTLQVGTYDLWQRYDAVNRLTLSKGQNSSGTLTGGIILSYDLAGNRLTRTEQIQNPSGTGTVANTETNTYDGMGRLVFHGEDVQNWNWASYTYDRASRQTSAIIRLKQDGQYFTQSQYTSYDVDGLITSQTVEVTGQPNSTTATTFGNSNFVSGSWTQGYDAAGNLRGYTVAGKNNLGTSYLSTYSLNYRLGESYLETSQTLTVSGPGPAPNTTSKTYDLNGNLLSFADSQTATRNRWFAYNANGQMLTSITGLFDVPNLPTHASAFVAAVNAVHPTGSNGRYYFEEGNSIGRIFDSSYNYINNVAASTGWAFDVDDGAASGENIQAPSQVIARQGDTLRVLAQRIYGDASLWYVIADENGLQDPDAPLAEGLVLRLPNDVISLANNAQSFKPFDLNAAIGDTTPYSHVPYVPPPRPKSGCGVLGMILIVIVVIIVTIYTAGAAAGGSGAALAGGGGATAGSTWAAGTAALSGGLASTGTAIGAAALGGAVGSIAGQLAGMAMGMQEKFDWSGVAIGAISSGVGAGLGAVGPTSKLLDAFGKAGSMSRLAATAAISNALTQGTSIATGLQSSFSWREVAIAAISAPVAALVGDAAGSAFKNADASLFANRFAGSVASSYVRKAFGGKIDSETIFADAFGNAVGNFLVDAISRPAASAVSVGAHEEQHAGPVSADGDDLSEVEVTAGRSVRRTGSGKRASVEIEVLPQSGYGGGSGSGPPIIGYNAENEPVYSAGTGTEIVGEMHRTDDTEGLYYSEKQNFTGQKLVGYEDDAGHKAWGYQHNGEMKFIRMDPTTEMEGLASPIAQFYGVDEASVDAKISRGETGVWGATKYGVGTALYKAHNFVTLGFVERQENRWRLHTVGAMSDSAYHLGTTVDAVGTSASVLAGGGAYRFALARLGNGYTGLMIGGAAAGGTTDLLNQGTQMVNYSLTDGLTGQREFSVGQFTMATGGGAAVGGLIRGAQNVQFLNRPLSIPFLNRGPQAPTGVNKYLAQGHNARQASYLNEPYPESGMGHHFLKRSWKLPNWLKESPLSVLKPKGITRGDFYERHFRVDNDYYGSAFPKSIGGSWRGRAIGLQKYGPMGQVWYGSPTALKLTVGGAAAAGGAAVYYFASGDD